MRLADGTLRWTEAVGRVDLAPDGRPLRFPGVLLDIERRRAAETERDRAQHILETFVEAVPGVVYAKDLEGRIVLANRGYAEDVGRPLEECLGRTEDELLSHSDSARIIMATDRRIMEKGVAEQIEERVSYGDRAPAVWFSTKAPLRDSAGQVVGLVGSSLDITARKEAEAALAESESRFRNMADHSPAIMWIANPEGRCTYLNARWLEITGQSEADIEDHGWLEAIHPEDRPACERLFADGQERKIPFRVEFRIWTKEAGWRWVLDAAAPRWDADGAFRGFIGSMIDITDRKATEVALAESEQRFRKMADHAPVMMWVTDASGVSTYHNQVWHRFTGQSPAEALGFGWLDAIDPDDRAEAETTFLGANARRSPIRVEYRLRRADGASRWVLDAATPRLGPDGSFLG